MGNFAIDLKFGRGAYGSDPVGYHAIRPAYPEWVFEMLVERGCIFNGAAAFEIGAGTGTATRHLVELGVNPLVIIEPDERMAGFLCDTIQCDGLSVLSVPFEEASLTENSFDFGFSATSFHWLNEEVALEKIAKSLRPGGWFGMAWNVFGVYDRYDAFHEATKELLAGPMSPAEGPGMTPFGLDFKSRIAALERTNAFDSIEYKFTEWPWLLDAAQTVALYSTFSNIKIREDKNTVLTELGRIATEQFPGGVIRNMATCLYIAKRKV